MKKNKSTKTSKASKQSNQNYYYGIAAGTLTLAFIAMIYRLSQNSNETVVTHSHASSNDELSSTLPFILQSQEIAFENIKANQLLECESKLNYIRKQSLFPNWLQTYTVKVDPRLNDHENNIKKAQQLCKQAFQEIIAEESFFPNLFPPTLRNLEIILINANTAHNRDSIGVYSLKSNQIGIVYKPDNTIHDYKKALKNEFFAHQVAARNIINQLPVYSSDDGANIFLKKSGKIDEAAVQKFELIFNTIKQSIEQYKRLLAKPSTHEKNKRDTVIQLAKDYVPKTFYSDKEEFEMALKLHVITQPDEDGYYTSGANYPKHLPLSYGRKVGDKITYTHCKDETPESKAVALFADLTMQLNALESTNGPYYKKNKADKLNEFASSMSELPTKLLKNLFGNYYQCMCDFFSNDQTDKAKQFKEFYQQASTEATKEKIYSTNNNNKPNFFKPQPKQPNIANNHPNLRPR